MKLNYLSLGLSIIGLCGLTIGSAYALDKKCFLLTSYDSSYSFEKQNADGAKKVLAGNCEVNHFEMDTKRNPSEDFKKTQGKKACTMIAEYKPDVVIALDDNASKYVVVPCLKNSSINVVFAGVNWSTDAYGYPFQNATGMVEVQPINQLLEEIKRTDRNAKRGAKIVQDRLSEMKNAERYQKIAKLKGLELDVFPFKSAKGFEDAFKKAQTYDFIIFGELTSVNDLTDAKLKQIVNTGTKLSAAATDLVIPYVMVTMSQVNDEQGRYAAEVAVELLRGTNISDFPVIANREVVVKINKDLLDGANVKLRPELVRQALDE